MTILQDHGITTAAETYDLAFFVPYNLFEVDTVVGGMVIPRRVLLSDAAGHAASAVVPASTLNTVLKIRVNSTLVATVLFTMGSTTGTVTLINPLAVLNAGDMLTISTDTVADVIISGIGITLVTY